MTNVAFEEAYNPDWEAHDESKGFHWTKEVPSYVRALWETFTPEQQVNIANWARAQADWREDRAKLPIQSVLIGWRKPKAGRW